MKKTFTLIELLVVIAIIAILAAMLLPALQQARERGIGAKCVSNLKNVSMAAAAYRDDSQDWNIESEYNWRAAIIAYTGVNKIKNYDNKVHILNCIKHPAEGGKAPGYFGITYWMHQHFSSRLGRHVRHAQVRYPSALAFILEASAGQLTTSHKHKYYGDGGSWKQRIAPFHNGRHYLAYYDGHIGSFRWYQMPAHLESDGVKLWYVRGVSKIY